MNFLKTIVVILLSTGFLCEAQSVTPPVPTTINLPNPTISSAEPVEMTTHETISLATGNVAFFLPVASFPQRNGSPLNLGFVLDGNTYSLREPHNMFESMPTSQGDLAPTETFIQNSPSLNTMLWPQPIHTNLPSLTADRSYAGLDSYNYCAPPEGQCSPADSNTFENWPEYCVQNWTFTDWDGSSHPFNGTRDCSEVTMLNTPTGDSYWAFIENLPLKKQVSGSVDDAFYVLDATNTSDIRVNKRDGTVYHFSGYPSTGYVGKFNSAQNSPSSDFTSLNWYSAFFSTIVDPNGNTISYANGVITDTIGRSINVTTTSIGYTAMNGQSTKSVTATATKQTATSTAPWPVTYPPSQVPGANGGCRVNYVQPNGQGIQPTQLIYNGPEGGTLAAPTTYNITLQNGTLYTLTFDVTGNVIKVTYPTGGYTKYDYLYGGNAFPQSQNFGDVTCVVQPDQLLAKHECNLSSGACTAATTVTAVGSCTPGWPTGGEATTCYSGMYGVLQPGANAEGSSGPSPPTIIDPYGNKSVHGFGGNFTYTIGSGNSLTYHVGFYAAGEQDYLGQSTLLKSVVNSSSNSATGCVTGQNPFNLQPCSVTTTYSDTSPALSRVVQYTYDTTAGYPNVTKIQEYDFSNNLIKTTSATWEHGGIYQSGAAGSTALSNVLDHVQNITLTDGTTGYTDTKTFTYDSLGNLQQSTVTGTNLAALSTVYTPLDAYGRPTQMKDPKGNITKYSYADRWFDSSCPTSTNPQAYLTSVTNAVNQTTYYNYDSCTGEVGSFQDPNNNLTKFTYDVMGRTLGISYPDGGSETVFYSDTAPAAPDSIQTTKVASPNPNVVSTTIFDGLSRKVQTQVSDPSGADYVDTTYDSLGRVSTVSNPYRYGVPSIMNGVTTYGYDALSRKTYELEADGTSKQYWCYDGTADPAHPQSNCHSNGSSFTSGTWVDHSDEVGNNWQHVSDAEARLRAVIEPYSYETDYLYDGFSDLKQVDQWGGAHGSATDHQRLFSYDALSRLTSATNPETGTVGYGYDADSNVVTKTDARGVTTTYSYDPLNRLVGKSYAGDAAATPWSCYQYDGASTANQVGRIINEWTQSAAIGACATIAPTTGFLSKRSFLLYDPMGRIKSEWQYTLANSSGTPYKPVYTYDLAGNLLTSTDGTTPSPTTSGATLTFAYTRDQASHLLTVSSNWSDSVHPASLFSAQTGLTPSPCGTTYSSTTPYAAFGGLMNATLGSSITLNRGYYTRLWMECEIDGSAGAAAATSGSATIGITGNEQIK